MVRTNVDKLGGALDIDSEPGAGTTISLRLPLTVAIIPCLLAAVGNDRFAIPQKDLEELVCLFPHQSSGQIEYAYDQEVYRLRERLLPLVRLEEVLAAPATVHPGGQGSDRAQAPVARRAVADITAPPGEPIFIAVVKAGRHRYGLVVDQILNTEEVVVKPMQSTMKNLLCYSGATIMGDGRVALILDLEGVARHAGVSFEIPAEQPPSWRKQTSATSRRCCCSSTASAEQFAMALPMIRRVALIQTSRLERIGDKEFIRLDGVTMRVLRLDQFLEVSPAPGGGARCTCSCRATSASRSGC